MRFPMAVPADPHPAERGPILRLKYWMAERLCSPAVGRLVGLVFGGTTPHRGVRIATPSPVSDATRAAIFWGIYESAETRFVRRFLRPDLDTIELGANIGVVSRHTRSVLDPSRRLIAVEPNATLIPVLCKNAGADAGNRVIHAAIVPRGVSSVALHQTGESTGAFTTPAPAADADDIPVTTLEGLLESESVGDYALVSDIEGGEIAFIDTDRDGPLARCRLAIMELHETKSADGTVWTVDDLLTHLIQHHGFRLLGRRGPVVALDGAA